MLGRTAEKMEAPVTHLFAAASLDSALPLPRFRHRTRRSKVLTMGHSAHPRTHEEPQSVHRPRGRRMTVCGWAAMVWMCAAMVGLAACDAAMHPVDDQAKGLPANSGVERDFSGVTQKTFTAPVGRVGTATLQSLNYMDIGLTEVRKASRTWDITAAAGARLIDIHLEAVTPKTTLMRVTVDQGDPFFKDGATATEIVLQTADALHERKTTQTAAQPARSRGRSARAAEGL